MIRRLLRQCVRDEFAQRQGVGQPPGNATFRIDPFQVPQQERTKVHSRGDAGASQAALVITPAQPLQGTVKVVLVENLIQAIVKSMRRCAHHLAPDDPQIFLPLAFLTGSHGHAL